MKAKLIIGLTLLAAVLVLSGCMTTFASDSGQLAYGEMEGSSAGSFETSEGFIYFIHPELVTFGDKHWENLDAMIEPELSGVDATAARELEIDYGFTGMDYLLSMFVPFVSWGTIEVRGTAVE
ncbi:MAG: hypothetical protein ACLFUM_02420 [Spirochaetaceae bacterium]